MKITNNGTLRKDNETFPCKYHRFVECSKGDYNADMCTRCGWNPIVEMKRVERIKKQPVKRRPSKRLIFTKRWE